MSNDFDRLRQTMSELSEHGGNTDLYDRSVLASRRMTRNRRVSAGLAVAAATVAIAAPVALADARRSAPAPITPATGAPVPTTTMAPPSLPASSSPAVSRAPAGSRSPSAAAADGCPLTAKMLKPGTGISDWSKIECHSPWAIAVPGEGATGGDGVFVFRYSAGRWTEAGQGSSEYCESTMPRDAWRDFALCGNRQASVACPMGSEDIEKAIARSDLTAGLPRKAAGYAGYYCEGKDAFTQARNSQQTVAYRWDSSADTWRVVRVGSCARIAASLGLQDACVD